MARNEEKALTLFNKWETFKRDFHSTAANRRPLQTTDCDSLPEAEKYRRDLIRDITRKISLIQNGSQGEHRIREINDEINKMMRQKYYWESRIKDLGGTVQKGRQFYDIDGKELPGAPGYRYYGAAKELPGVRELFAELDEELNEQSQKRTRADMYKDVTPDYYGYRDDDDGVLVAKEAIRQEELLTEARSEHKRRKEEILRKLRRSNGKDRSVLSSDEIAVLEDSDSGDNYEIELQFQQSFVNQHNPATIIGSSDKEDSKEEHSASTDPSLRSHVPVPTQSDINELLLAEKRRALLEKVSSL